MGHFWVKTYHRAHFYENWARWSYWALYKNLPFSHGRPLKVVYIPWLFFNVFLDVVGMDLEAVYKSILFYSTLGPFLGIFFYLIV